VQTQELREMAEESPPVVPRGLTDTTPIEHIKDDGVADQVDAAEHWKPTGAITRARAKQLQEEVMRTAGKMPKEEQPAKHLVHFSRLQDQAAEE
jgi:hypothetical protein